MKKIFTIKDSLENKISYYHLVLFLALLPFDRFYTELIVISFTLHSLIHCKRENLQLILTRQNVVLTSVFLLTVIGCIWSPSLNQSLKDAERQLSILIFPVMLSITNLNLGKYKKNLLLLLGTSCTLAVLYLFIDAIRVISYYHLPWKTLFSSVFVHHNFSAPIDIHATYFSMYIALSIISFTLLLIEENNKKHRIFYLVSLLILSAGLLQLTSKSVLTITILFLLIGFPFFLRERIKKIKLITAGLAIVLITMLSITTIDSFKKRYISELKGDLTEPSLDNEILEPRIVRWKAAMKLVYKKPILGYGSGSERKLLKEKYFEENLYNSYLNELNAHNQYISFLLKTGIFGLLIFLFTLYTGFKNAWQSRDTIFLGFLSLIAVVSFSENILDVNKGIFFYAFFLAFFTKANIAKPE